MQILERFYSQSDLLNRVEKLAIVIHKNRLTVKTAQFAMFIFGIAILSSLTHAQKSMSLRTRFKILFIGLFLPSASYISHLFFNVIAPPRHSMKMHVFQEKGYLQAALEYHKNTPILTIDYSKGFKLAGQSHGYLCGEVICRIRKTYDFVLHTILKIPRQSQFIALFFENLKMKIPQEYLEEMEGIVLGVNQWCLEHFWQFPKQLTINELLFLHLLPDMTTLNLHRFTTNCSKVRSEILNQLAFSLMKSTLHVSRDENGGPVLNCTLGLLTAGTGKYSLIIRRQYKDHRQNTTEVGFPGFCGTFTGVNKGLSLALSRCYGETSTIQGMPSSLYSRKILETCESVEDVRGMIQKIHPLGASHVTVADIRLAARIQVCQGADDKGSIFQLLRIENQLKDQQEESNWLSVHRIQMKHGLEKNVIKVAFDNAFVGVF